MLAGLFRSIHHGRQLKRQSIGRGLGSSVEFASRPRILAGTLRVLGIESSCDDSCASIVASDKRILSNVRLGQNHVHKAFNGIHPYHAIHAHQINIPIAIGRALKEADIKLTELDGIAYTRGPGMAGCLAVGATAAKSLAAATGVPLLAVHHMQAHALTPFLTQTQEELAYPFLTLLVSGGHTMLVLVSSSSEFKILANTADKPLGLAIDKISRALDVPWPDGSASPGSALEMFVTAAGEEAQEEVAPLPLALRTGPSVFSFCGLQTATMRRLDAISDGHPSSAQKRAIGRAFFDAAFGQIEGKIRHWILELSSNHAIKLKGLVISGGVGSNQILRDRVERLLRSIDLDLKLHIPPISFCTDNAAMVAWTGIDKLVRGKTSGLDVPVAAKWSIEDAEDESAGTMN
ncbi:hypothetical protein PTTG_07262 [Puccinia triticina 1-1 BBBD Race 1]|uniref:N(6)-L-threonylcarbamoyladenine synthase n=2 Tax=Puccinia triticina TaxID=208348 RepID=A0A0C4F2E1_PUCT1|nr:uncharacterized protein PtA15_17A78 [Puccinia triticina]OAV90989.1 hypothetical protein PTTG_07262 [Puccinia triticina 1-1 BBBD Race 1]WAQ92597.1 hypothetical protein PtA15_17A78 [Puccinia triticina]WAR63477.1 hypothetical protein PtB15_17B77 [Puccinia triticina]